MTTFKQQVQQGVEDLEAAPLLQRMELQVVPSVELLHRVTVRPVVDSEVDMTVGIAVADSEVAMEILFLAME